MNPLATTTAIILAAGQGTRMKSATPKVLHAIAGRPLVHNPVAAALEAGCGEVVVVVGHGREQVAAYLAKAFEGRVKTAVQEQQKGTGDAARAGMSAVSAGAERVLIYYGDVPLLAAEDLVPVVTALGDAPGLALATCEVAEPFGYGRVLRDQHGEVLEIREQRDLRDDRERAVREINPGIYAAGVALVRAGLASLQPNNAQGELYLTDLVAYARGAGGRITGVRSRGEVLGGVNDRQQLAEADQAMVERIARKWRVAGVTVRAGARIEAGVTIDLDATIETGACLRGATRIGRGAVIDVGCVLTNVEVAEGVVMKPYTVASDSRVGPRAQLGPFSHLRPESDIGEDAHVGNFVETKKTRMDKGAKANHLAYLGDGIIGAGANIGAGTIFCNYDGFQKHTTTIEAGAFIGSDSQLVAPVRVGEGAYVGTGTTVTRDVPANALALSRVKQENKEGYALKLRARMKAAKEEAAKGSKTK
ncbi:MAG: bifunctional UDP-N-acetylglucosamine diphosphorylase/glucosamine-1-phosphate N-acetyltransferase GlmU [Polyangiaceae bacterium]